MVSARRAKPYMGLMPPLIRALCVLLLAPLLGAPAERLPTPDPLRAAGWQKGGWPGIKPAIFEALPDGGLRITGVGQGSFVWRTVAQADACLYWRWRVDQGPPPTPLNRKGGDDRAIAITVGFDGWPPDVGIFQKAQHAMAQAMAGDHRLPRSMIAYVWGGSGQEPRPFVNPYVNGLGKVYIRRAADAEKARWFDEKAEITRDWRAAFKGATVPPVLEIVIGTDVDDTNARLDARIERIRFAPC
jgi:hypothetical protein